MKRNYALTGLVLALFGGMSAYAAGQITNERPPKGRMEAGEASYLANCAACHQPTGKGLPGAFPPMADSDYTRSLPTDKLVGIVLHGFSGKVTVNGADYDLWASDLASNAASSPAVVDAGRSSAPPRARIRACGIRRGM